MCFSASTPDSGVFSVSGDYSNVVLVVFNVFLYFGILFILPWSIFISQLNLKILNNLRHLEEDAEGIQKLETSKQSIEDFANDKRTLLTAVKGIGDQHLLKLMTDDTTQQWAKEIVETEARERSKWVYTPFPNP